MRKAMLAGVFAYVLSFILLGGAVPVLAEDASIVRATRVDGSVMKNDVPLKEGDIVQRDEKILAGANAAAVLTWSNGSMVEVYPGTAVVLQGITYEGDRKLEKSLLNLETGRLFVKAQVPENIFCQFEVRMGGITAMTQGSEFALNNDAGEKKSTIWSLLGVLIVEMDTERVRIEDGRQVVLKAGTKPESPAPMSEKTKESLNKTSKRLGGSLLAEEEPSSSGGPLVVKIGGVMNRRGNAPYTVKLKALTKGGSGKLKSIRWSFGDGESAFGKEAQHTFTQGVYPVVIQVEDENGQKATAQINISAEEDCNC